MRMSDGRADPVLTKILIDQSIRDWSPPVTEDEKLFYAPGPRDEWYSASALYSRALYVDVIPALPAGRRGPVPYATRCDTNAPAVARRAFVDP